MQKRLTLFEVFLNTLTAAAVGLAIVAFAAWPKLSYGAPVAGRPDLVEVIEINGEINRGTPEEIGKRVEALKENPKVKAVLLSINSPGGGALETADLYQKLGEIKVPVVVWCKYLCASGGMYAAMAPSVKFVSVSRSTIAGSIGVISHMTRYYRLLEWLKIDAETYKSGELKDAGNPSRAPTVNETKYLQGIIDDLAAQFYAVVKKARPNIKDWAAIKSARIFIGQQAVDVGLADAVMTEDEAIAKAKSLSGSSQIFTREELKKMAKSAEDSSGGGWYNQASKTDGWTDDLHWAVETLKEIKSGQSIRLEYRLPYSLG